MEQFLGEVFQNAKAATTFGAWPGWSSLPAPPTGSLAYKFPRMAPPGPLCSELNRNPLDDVAGDLFLAVVVEAGGARVGMAGQALHIFQRHALLEQIGKQTQEDVQVIKQQMCGNFSRGWGMCRHVNL